MPDAKWNELNATLSHNNAGKEFGLTEAEIFEAIRQGKLQYKLNYAHGNPYYRLLRAEVISLVQELHGVNFVQKQEAKHKLQTINKEINSLKRKLASLERQKIELIEIQNKADSTPETLL
jgi:hypothetical protein